MFLKLETLAMLDFNSLGEGVLNSSIQLHIRTVYEAVMLLTEKKQKALGIRKNKKKPTVSRACFIIRGQRK